MAADEHLNARVREYFDILMLLKCEHQFYSGPRLAKYLRHIEVYVLHGLCSATPFEHSVEYLILTLVRLRYDNSIFTQLGVELSNRAFIFVELFDWFGCFSFELDWNEPVVQKIYRT